MVEPISLIASAITVAGTGTQLASILFNVAQSLKNAPAEIAELADEVSTLSRSLMSLADTIETNQALCKPALFLQTESILCRFKLVEEELKELTKKRRTLERWRWVLRRPKAKVLMVKIESIKSALALELNIIQLAKEEVKRS